jgi:hypothetical protein
MVFGSASRRPRRPEATAGDEPVRCGVEAIFSPGLPPQRPAITRPIRDRSESRCWGAFAICRAAGQTGPAMRDARQGGQGAESLTLSRGCQAERQAESLMLVHPQPLGEIVERHQ